MTGLSERIAKDLCMSEKDAAVFEAARHKTITERLTETYRILKRK